MYILAMMVFPQDLKNGRDRLKREVMKSECAPVRFMQDNLDAFLLCYQTLSDILHPLQPTL